MKSHFVMLAHYNRWANKRIYDAAEALPEADYRADKGAFFGSLQGTLNHLLVADQIWLRRFTGKGPVHTRLDMILHEDLASLRKARVAEDERIVAFIDGLTEHDLAGTFTYVPITNPQQLTQPYEPALIHFFNHQTHHRGQAHAIVTSIAGKNAGPVLDLIAFQRESGMGMG
jgi:uncharacterized damage-inducible protein DinB